MWNHIHHSAPKQVSGFLHLVSSPGKSRLHSVAGSSFSFVLSVGPGISWLVLTPGSSQNTALALYSFVSIVTLFPLDVLFSYFPWTYVLASWNFDHLSRLSLGDSFIHIGSESSLSWLAWLAVHQWRFPVGLVLKLFVCVSFSCLLM